MTQYPIFQVDVFTDVPLQGNPAAVVFDADDMPASTMQAIAREMNLSETVFVLRPTHPEAHYRVRIFSPGKEFPFAGHPTLATAFAVLKKGDQFPDGCVPEVLCQECGIGIVPVRITGEATERRVFTMTQARPQYRESGISRGLMAELLGSPEEALVSGSFEVVSTGLPWLIAEIASQPALSALKPNQGRIAEVCAGLETPGITVFCENPANSMARIRLRTFAPVVGVAEDPVCGSGNGCVAAWLARHRHANKNTLAYTAEQGVEIGRHGWVHVAGTRTGDTWSIDVGGAAVSVLSGTITLPYPSP